MTFSRVLSLISVAVFMGSASSALAYSGIPKPVNPCAVIEPVGIPLPPAVLQQREIQCLYYQVNGLTQELAGVQDQLQQLAKKPDPLPVISSLFEGQKAEGQVGVLGLNYYIAVGGLFPTPGANLTQTVVGQIILFAGDHPLGNWLPCDGRLLPVATNTALFSVIGNMYGGDGVTTFALPDLRGRVPMNPL